MSGTGCEGTSNPLTCPPRGRETPKSQTVDAGCHGDGSSSPRASTHADAVRVRDCHHARRTQRTRSQCSFSVGPFPAYLKRFHLPDSDYCSCGGIGTALHYATESIYTVSRHMRKPAPNFEQEWLKRVANNLVSRQKTRGIIKFMSENRDLFRPP
ncbi:hypothetical protein AVEN_56574-1 [Araneus ventricosus]|uniref:Uncharacterized protein n=1 Tax=Araneus ventricosus TaxID=182803 RepID=A0A4Y2K2I1_ARAVE|nr:hypothetical protein AVEN_56574-1 [Araneus ventricosus]